MVLFQEFGLFFFGRLSLFMAKQSLKKTFIEKQNFEIDVKE